MPWTKGFLFFFSISYSVPTVPVKNLNGSSPVHPALAGKNLRMPTSEKAGPFPPQTVFLFSSRDHWNPDECCRSARVSDPASETGPAPPTRQQERHQTRARLQPLLQKNYQETGSER